MDTVFFDAYTCIGPRLMTDVPYWPQGVPCGVQPQISAFPGGFGASVWCLHRSVKTPAESAEA